MNLVETRLLNELFFPYLKWIKFKNRFLRLEKDHGRWAEFQYTGWNESFSMFQAEGIAGIKERGRNGGTFEDQPTWLVKTKNPVVHSPVLNPSWLFLLRQNWGELTQLVMVPFYYKHPKLYDNLLSEVLGTHQLDYYPYQNIILFYHKFSFQETFF